MALIRAQHHQQSVQVFGLTHAFAWQHLHQLLARFGLQVLVVDFGVDVTGANGIDVDAKLAPLHRHRFGHLDNGRLAHAIHTNLGQNFKSSHGRNVDDAPAGEVARGRSLRARQHALAHLLSHEEGALDVGVEHEIKVIFGHILNTLRGADARVVDQNVDGADFGLRVGHS